MIKELTQIFRDLAYFSELGRRNNDELKDLRNRHNELALGIQQLAMEIERLRENEAHEREKLLLRVENLLAKTETKEAQPTRSRKKLST